MKQPPVPAKRRGLVPSHAPHGSEPAPFTSADATALQAVASGTANDGQQKRALDWILKSACGLPVWPYRADERETCVALGRQFVGQQIMGVLKVNISVLRKRESAQTSRGDVDG
jgi:hypothetical protein